MKTLFLAALAALSLSVGVANAAVVGDHSTVSGDRNATLMQQGESIGSGG